ncbi:very short patch repair endonuclease [Mycolicibacterium septicum]|uniref:Very short patch repair endonuclease n=2 Tax=Mycolicibacterium septicum TaxID=98668 RepID=A0ABW9LU36_9MYCO
MRANRSRDTRPEKQLRSSLHAMGLRFRVCTRPIPSLKRTADIVFGPSKVAVFVDGCFWHGCPEHYTAPKTNADFWRSKIQRNKDRDLDTDSRLAEAGWQTIHAWEHEDVAAVTRRVAIAVELRRPSREIATPGAAPTARCRTGNLP